MRWTTRLRALAGAAAVGAAASAWATSADAQTPDPDLVKLGESLLPTDDPKKPAKKAVPAARRDAGVAAGTGVDAGATAQAPPAVVTSTDSGATDSGAADSGPTEPDTQGVVEPEAGIASPPASPTAASPDAGDSPRVGEPGPKPEPPPASKQAPARASVGPAARKARFESGQNIEPQAAEESPLAAAGVPVAAVPAVATATTVGLMAVWPFVVKTVSALLKSFLGAFLKSRAKKGVKIDRTQRSVRVGGFAIRPFEMASLLLGALVYGVGVTYAFQGKDLDASFLFKQEALIIVIYYSRAFIRFGYERIFNLPTQFRFWPGGGALCLVSAYLGSALGTVGYEVEEAPSPEDARRIVTMKAWLVALAFAMSLVFFAANVLFPMKLLQSARVMMSGLALAEILPITPMPGKRIREELPKVWWLLATLIVPMFILINFVL